MSYPLTIPTAEPFLFSGGPVGVLLIHGFTGAPKEMRWMGEYLAGKGYTVLGIRLAGHATTPEDMTRATWKDWVASVEDGLNLLSGVTKTQVVSGLSMGGALSLYAAAHYPVAAAAAISAPYAINDPRLKFIRLLAPFMPKVAKGAGDWHNPEAAKDHVDYPYNPTHAIAELVDLLKEVRSSIPLIKIPTLLVHSRNDTGVPPENMDKIYAALTTARKERLWVEDSGHVVVREPERFKVFEAVDAFFRSVITTQ
ncbi:MAG TPA: alpha/beta fold hydrolase [Longilinea sp.]|nr:alpha/beta fold hydrolase [Longilinea sp.]